MIAVTAGLFHLQQYMCYCIYECVHVSVFVADSAHRLESMRHMWLLQRGEECTQRWLDHIRTKCMADGISCANMPQVSLTEFVSGAKENKGIWGVFQVPDWYL